MKLTNQVVVCRERRVDVAGERCERRLNRLVIVPRVFMRPMFMVPVIRLTRGPQTEAVPGEEELLTAVGLLNDDTSTS
jgi:hypothetical protein